ncbi:heterokaryon incompatibility protein-domain-containing protein [Lasiosphaeris hirsuta]|uniref:Heterokaryon incompatibility protein-domain-containing protein n=1 Tax=Lasiosphaeris hirsuta TaxID=260670 RepID=A0AA40AFU3_9PEZI|nr:heterokaryon incompatibility protein-domain-containing protein [Lasiosphaeris hirsuta]
MRLLHTTNHTLHSFVGPPDNAPKYAILSHTWGDEELLFEDMATPEKRSVAALSKPEGFAKMWSSCAMAKVKGFEYIWIDTCCIDKSSSAELSEAINSMFKWYALSELCLAYISDYGGDEAAAREAPSSRYDASYLNPPGSFTGSRWFTRGWTLQELIAPMTVAFCNRNWEYIGDRSSLAEAYTRAVSGEPAVNLIRLKEDLTAVSIAARMSWASDRVTTRDEDIAYCLLGIFNVNMPLLYGEGDKAFLRLQEEIIKNPFDQSILVCSSYSRPEGRWAMILAPHPSCFHGYQDVQLLRSQALHDSSRTHPEGIGLQVWLCSTGLLNYGQLQEMPLDSYVLATLWEGGIIESEPGMAPLFLAILDCCVGGNFTKRLALLLYSNRDRSRYFRAQTDGTRLEMGDTTVDISRLARQQAR